MLAVLDDDDWCALIGIDIIDRLVLLALALLPFCPRSAVDLVVQLERPHLLGSHLPRVEVAHGAETIMELAAIEQRHRRYLQAAY